MTARAGSRRDQLNTQYYILATAMIDEEGQKKRNPMGKFT
jgi:hypothetical protein